MSALSSKVAVMTAGSWDTLTTVNTGSSTSAGAIYALDGLSGSRIGYMNKGTWDPINSQVLMCCADHDPTPRETSYVKYVESTNTWSKIGAVESSTGSFIHGYDDNAINPADGKSFFYKTASQVGYAFSYNGSTWPQTSAYETGNDNLNSLNGVSLSYWSGTLTGGGVSGTLVLFDMGRGSGAPSHLVCYNPLTDSWFGRQDIIFSPEATDPTSYMLSAYSSVYNCIVFGGGSVGRQMRRLNSDLTITSIQDAPRSIGINGGNFTVDPVSGKFLLVSGNGGASSLEMYELDPSSGLWSAALTGGSVPPSSMAIPGEGPVGDTSHLISIPISTYGVIMYVSRRYTDGSINVYLYKHTTSSPATVKYVMVTP